MKKQTLLLVANCFLAVIAANPAHAQTYDVKVKVPFDFTMGDKTYRTGEYVFSTIKDTVVLKSSNGMPIAMALANQVIGHSAVKGGKVVFDCYTSRCFVSETWTPGEDRGRQLLQSRTEMELASQQTGKYLVLLGTNSQQSGQ